MNNYPDGCTQFDIDWAAGGYIIPDCLDCGREPCECCPECGASPRETHTPDCEVR